MTFPPAPSLRPAGAALRAGLAGAAVLAADLNLGTLVEQGRPVPWGGVLCALDQMLRGLLA